MVRREAISYSVYPSDGSEIFEQIEWPEIEQEVWWNDGKRTNGRKQSREPFDKTHDRPFIAWDGEGITYPDNPQQAYVLFAASTGDYITAAEGACLSTQQCLDLLFSIEERFPYAYHIGFGFGYDVNQILNSLSRRNIFALSQATKKGRTFHWNGYRIKLHPGKMIRISKGEEDDRRTVTVYDTFGFFQTSFLKVVAAYAADKLHTIESGKRNRSTFTYAEIREITRYCLAENDLLVEIMQRLRSNFEERGLYLRDWHGPGAVASASLKKYNIKRAMGRVPEDVARASRLAYQGGRFELLRAGYHSQKVWQYDINSAYPSAIVGLPDLSTGVWEFQRSFEPGTFGVWNVSYVDRRSGRFDRNFEYRAQPLFYRNYDGRVAYPPKVEGWYWTPEIENIIGIRYPAEIEIKGGWVFRGTDRRPFAHIEDIYAERTELKKQGLGGLERVLKLEINSYYGKFAQRSGWFQPGDRIPTYHQLEWAGYITSSARAKLWRLYNDNVDSIFSFETDAIFSTRPIKGIDIGEQLGQFSEAVLNDILYIQSGFYFAHHSGGTIEHYRGFDRGSLSFDMVYEWLDQLDPMRFMDKPNQRLYGQSHRFIGFKRALASRRSSYWRTWDTTPREITIGRDGKRVHMPGCPICRQVLQSGSTSSANHSGGKWTDGLHGLVTVLPGGRSNPHKIPWMDKKDEAEEPAETDIWEGAVDWDVEDELDKTDGFIV